MDIDKSMDYSALSGNVVCCCTLYSDKPTARNERQAYLRIR